MGILKTIALAFGVALAAPAFADGVDPLYDQDGNYIADVEIVGDVFDRNGTEYARLDIRPLRLTLYVDPDAVYVLLDPNNHIIRNQTPFSGYWIGWDPDPDGTWRRCDYGSTPDHAGRNHQLYGDLIWTNLSYSDNEGLVFAVDLGFCGDQVVPWATNVSHQTNGGPGPVYDPWDLNTVRDICGNASDLQERAVGCSRVIGHPEAPLGDVTWALWSRAYVRCGQSVVPDTAIIADLMTAVRLEPYTWQEYFRDVAGYAGPLDGRITYELYEAVGSYVANGCN